jgi:flagellar hook protein FlgE
MALFGALSIGRSGLINSGAALSVIGNNIANVNTTGFKGSRVEFADLLSADAGGDIGKIGLGARIGTVRTLFTQGPIEATGRALDLGIDGQGFFVLRDGTGQAYTRAGNFQIDKNGVVTDLLGHALQGHPVDATGTPTGNLQDVSIFGLSSAAKATTTVALAGNLEATAPLAGPFDGTSFQTAYATSNFQHAVRVFDSRGSAHDLTVFFTRTGDNTWALNVAADDGDFSGGTKGNLRLLSSGTLGFNSDGTLASVSGNTLSGVTFAGASAQDITLDVGAPGTTGGLSQFGSASAVSDLSQDGFAAGALASLSIDKSGFVIGSFDNGEVRPLFQLAIAQFKAPEGLLAAGNQLFRETIESGQAVIGTAGVGGNGELVSSALEQSNVQLAQEFIDLISTQRSFQANTKVITASDTLLGDLVNIIR